LNHSVRKHRFSFFGQTLSSYSHSPVAGNLPSSGHCLLPSSSPPPPLLPVRHRTATTLNNIPRSSLVWSHTTAPRGGIVKDPPIWAGGWPGSSSSIRTVSIPSSRNERSSRKLLARISILKSPVSWKTDYFSVRRWCFVSWSFPKCEWNVLSCCCDTREYNWGMRSKKSANTNRTSKRLSTECETHTLQLR
jgi:hypothetical protein